MTDGAAGPLQRVQTGSLQVGQKTRDVSRQARGPFHEVFNRQMKDSVSVSRHARVRMERDGIQLDRDQNQRLSSAVRRVADRGSHTSLVLMDDMAMVVNVRNRTLITVVSGDRQKDGVFTDIDSAVLAD